MKRLRALWMRFRESMHARYFDQETPGVHDERRQRGVIVEREIEAQRERLNEVKREAGFDRARILDSQIRNVQRWPR